MQTRSRASKHSVGEHHDNTPASKRNTANETIAGAGCENEGKSAGSRAAHIGFQEGILCLSSRDSIAAIRSHQCSPFRLSQNSLRGL